MLMALFPRQLPTVLVSSDHPTQRLAPGCPAQPAAHSNGKFSIFTAALWMGTDTELSKLPSVCCRWPGHKTSHEECREYFFQSGSFNYFLAGTALLRPLHTRCDRRVRDVWRCLLVCSGELNTFILRIKSSHCVNGVPTSAFNKLFSWNWNAFQLQTSFFDRLASLSFFHSTPNIVIHRLHLWTGIGIALHCTKQWRGDM